MSETFYEIHGVKVLQCAAEGPIIRTAQEAVAVMGEAMASRAGLVAIPASRLASEFFQLRTGLAGEVLQKFVTYGLRLAIVGDISTFSSNSTALRDLIRESNRGRDVWFLNSLEDLSIRLKVESTDGVKSS